ncbi:multidrug effflux MFS transporter [Acidocella sp.]|uniref:multidrug effflux MFS transporter n=1 Tax=Acidocella sp. TaxID=50710 RepID=UPI002F3E4F89
MALDQPVGSAPFSAAASPGARIPHPGMGFREFVACLALMQAIVSLAIDMMVPALGQIGAAMHLEAANQRQWVITAFMLGFAAAQLVYGIAADRFGRKPVLLFALGLYVLCSLLTAAAPDFTWLLAARFLQGIGAAGTRVISISIIRDCYAGRRMAQVSSLTFMVFLGAPIIAPSIGQAVLLVAHWPVIFLGLGAYATLIWIWVALRLPETLNRADERALSIADITAAFRVTLSNRMALGYTLAMTALLGSWNGFINSAQQVFAQVFLVPKLFPLIFAGCAMCMAVAALTNARLVERLGMRPLSHAALLGFIAISVVQATLGLTGHDTLLRFAVLQGMMMFCFGLLAGNCNAIAMEPLGHIAGTAASVLGTVSMLGAALVGFLIGQSFDGTIKPLTTGFILCSLLGLAVVLAAEGGVLFRHRSVPDRK